MTEDPAEWPTIVLAHSPISFALMGPGHNHRRVLVRSSDSNMDLVGLDSIPRVHRQTFFDFLLRNASDLDPLFVRSRPRHPIENSAYAGESSRFTHLSFAWRGLASNEDLRDITMLFDNINIDLSENILERSIKTTEWQLAPLILMCELTTKRRLRRRKSARLAIITISAAYIIAILTIFWKYSLL